MPPSTGYKLNGIAIPEYLEEAFGALVQEQKDNQDNWLQVHEDPKRENRKLKDEITVYKVQVEQHRQG